MYKTTEIASSDIPSDNPVHQRLLYPYIHVSQLLSGNVLEIGCGTGRGVGVLADAVSDYTGVDKNTELMESLSKTYPKFKFIDMFLPPLKDLPSNHFDYVVTFQVIEHIPNDRLFLQEIYRMLKPGGKAIISTPNITHTLSRNPWHEREYKPQELIDLAAGIFDKVEAKGIGGNEKVWAYHEANRKSVQKIMRFDIFDLQHKLPASVLRMPYEILNRMNRNKLHKQQGSSVVEITHEDFPVVEDPMKGLDLFYILWKK